MKQQIIKGLVWCFVLSTVACSSTTSQSGEPVASDGRQQLVAKGECTFEECGSQPSSYAGEPKVECSSSSGSDCGWAAGDDLDSSVSYAYCEDSECPPRPAIDCPAGTAQASQQCGNENEQGCAWTTVCVPPRETTPCPDQNGCDGQPVIEIGIICKDGSSGHFVCVTDDNACFWERSCD